MNNAAMDNENNNKISIELKPEVAKGTYSNFALINHAPGEFVLDFITMLPGMRQPEVTNRIIMTPEHCKRLMNILRDNIGKYEAQFGKISLVSSGPASTLNIADLNPNGTKS